MITHPLDLNSRLRPRPRSFDWVFFVNIALIAMFFLFFGSRFILSPAINLPARPASQISYLPGSVVITVKANDQVFTDTGLIGLSQLPAWLGEKIESSRDASLIIREDAGVPSGTLLNIQGMAARAGFKLISILVEPVNADPFDTPAPSARTPGQQRD